MNVRRALGLVCAATLLASATAAGCTKSELGFNVLLPQALDADAAWIEVGVFADRCPEAKLLAGGLPPDGPLTRIAFRRKDQPPPVGDLKKGTYAFAAVARAADCAVIATGCEAIDIGDASEVAIRLQAAEARGATCGSGETCTAGRCVPTLDNGNPAIGANCSLQLLGAGPLGNPMSGSGTVVSAPGLVATDKGFLIAYREYDALIGAARLRLLPIDSGGGALPPSATTLPGRCVGSEEADATGIAFSGAKGLVALSRAPCGGVGGLDLFEFDATGAVLQSSFTGSGSAKVALSNAHALSPLPARSGYALAFLNDNQARVATISGVVLQSGVTPTFGATPPHTGAWVAATDKAVALLAAGHQSSPPPPGDAGAKDGGADAGAETGASSENTIRLNLVSGGASFNSLPAPVQLPGSFASAAVQGSRLIVVTDSVTPGQPAAFEVFDLGNPSPVANGGLFALGTGAVLFGDVAFQKDRAFFALEQAGGITLVAYDHATTTPALLRQIYLPSDPRVPAMKTLRDGRVAVAASDTRVAVAWTTARTLTEHDVLGGYAIFACTTP